MARFCTMLNLRYTALCCCTSSDATTSDGGTTSCRRGVCSDAMNTAVCDESDIAETSQPGRPLRADEFEYESNACTCTSLCVSETVSNNAGLSMALTHEPLSPRAVAEKAMREGMASQSQLVFRYEHIHLFVDVQPLKRWLESRNAQAQDSFMPGRARASRVYSTLLERARSSLLRLLVELLEL